VQNHKQDRSGAEGKRGKQDTSNCTQLLVCCLTLSNWAHKSTKRCNKFIYYFCDFRYM